MRRQALSNRKIRRRTNRPRSRSRPSTIVNMDNKQRISLTRMLSKEEKENFNTFRMYRQGGKIVLEPVCQIPEKDHWIYKDPKALASLLKGIKSAEEGRLHHLGSFAEYATDDDQD